MAAGAAGGPAFEPAVHRSRPSGQRLPHRDGRPQGRRAGRSRPGHTTSAPAHAGYPGDQPGHVPGGHRRTDGYKFCSDPAELQAYEVAIIREKLTEIRRFITSVVAPHAALQPKGRWIKHLNTQLSSVESTLDVIADFIDA